MSAPRTTLVIAGAAFAGLLVTQGIALADDDDFGTDIGKDTVSAKQCRNHDGHAEQHRRSSLTGFTSAPNPLPVPTLGTTFNVPRWCDGGKYDGRRISDAP